MYFPKCLLPNLLTSPPVILILFIEDNLVVLMTHEKLNNIKEFVVSHITIITVEGEDQSTRH